MKISCCCSTYGRPSMLRESVESFLRQDYEDKELIILNDDPDIYYMFEHPQVFVYNYQERFKSLGAKRNECAKLATGDYLAPWDDDDIYLPHRLKISAKYIGSGRFFKPYNAFFMGKNYKTPLDLAANMFHAQSMYTREFFTTVGMYNLSLDKGEDAEFETRARSELQVSKLSTKLPVNENYYIYKWGWGTTHLSVVGTTAKTKKEPVNGPYEIIPMWKHDYIKLAMRT